MSNSFYGFTALTGGTAGCLDNITVGVLANQDLAAGMVQSSGLAYLYSFNSTSALVADGVNVINPTGNAGNGRWILQNVGPLRSIGTAAGTDTYTATGTPNLLAYVSGQLFYGVFTNANTSATPTLAINGLASLTIVKNGTAALVAGDIPAGHCALLEYDGTYLRLLNPAITASSSGVDIIQTQVFS